MGKWNTHTPRKGREFIGTLFGRKSPGRNEGGGGGVVHRWLRDRGGSRSWEPGYLHLV